MTTPGGSIALGGSVFGGEPIPFIYLQIDAEPTMEFRHLRARGQTDGTIVRAVEFQVGRGGFDPSDYLAALPVNPNATALDDSQFTSDIDQIEWPNPHCLSCYCVIEAGEASVALGEIAIIGEVSQSPGSPVDGTKFAMAIGHFPLIAPNATIRYALRVTIQA
jgi:hypothetical protein